MKPLAISDYTLVTALGAGRAATLDALRASRSGLARQTFETATVDSWLGVAAGLDEVTLPPDLADFDCRNNRLAELGLRSDGFGERVRHAARRWGAARVGVFLGTSTSGILQAEIAYRHRDPASGALPASLHYGQTHNVYSLARYVRAALGLGGPAHVVSTACSSSAKVFAAAARMIEAGFVDAAVVGGVDSLCMTTLYGFQSLELISPDICRPWDTHRAGLSLGEGAAFALLEREADGAAAWLLGAGESSDGHHMSSPHPEGAGAADAMRGALAQAGLRPDAVDYLNLHGTGTPGNDAAEDRAVSAVFGHALPCSSSKGFTGHTLGAAGGVEAAITMLALQHGFMPAGLNLQESDPALRSHYLRELREQPLRVAASNSFGFGGSNACLIFGAAAVEPPGRLAASVPRGSRKVAKPHFLEIAVIEVAVCGIGVLGPGLDDWASAIALLRDPTAWQRRPTAVPPPPRLPAAERRRAGTGVKASIVVADQAVAAAAVDAARLATIFTSSTSDPVNGHLLCEALAAPDRLASPTRFTNSVHNAAAGYWHIACASRAPSTSLAAFDASFAAGLLEAAVQCRASGAPVLLVACDLPYPEPLHALRPVADVFAVALVIAPPGAGRALRLGFAPEAAATPCDQAGLEDIRRKIPAARALPLLQALAGDAAARLVLEGLPGQGLLAELDAR